MAVHIRFRRVGTNKRLQFHLVATDQRMPRDGRFLENLGYYDPNTQPITVRIDQERLDYWVKNGAQMSEATKRILKLKKHSKTKELEQPKVAS